LALAICLTLRAGFLAYPGWLAAQEAELSFGPILVGLYLHYNRPDKRFGWCHRARVKNPPYSEHTAERKVTDKLL
jgi:hypothetical protein